MRRIGQISILLVLFSTFCTPHTFAENLDSLRKSILLLNNDTVKVKRLFTLSDKYAKRPEFDSAIRSLDRALTISLKLNFLQGIAQSHYRKGMIWRDKGTYLESNNEFNLAITSFEKLNDKVYTAYSYNYIGSNYTDLGETSKAMEFFLRSLRIKEELKDKRGISTSYNGLGSLFMLKEEYDNAIKYFSESLKLKEELKDKRGMAICLNNIGNAHQAKKEYDEAFDFYLRSLKLKEEMGEKRSLISTYANIGVIYKNRKDHEKAIEFFQKAINNDISNNITSGLVSAYANLLSVYLIQKRVSEAEEILKKAIDVAQESGTAYNKKNALMAMIAMDTTKGNYQAALIHQMEADKIEKKMLQDQNRQGVVELLTQYEAAKKEQQIALLNRDKTLQLAELDKQSFQLKQNHQNLLLLEHENKLKEMDLLSQKQELDKKNMLSENQQKNIEILNKDKALKEAEAKQKEGQLKQKENVLYFVSSAGILVFILLGVAYRGYIQKKKSNAIVLAQKKEVEGQKLLIEAKQKEIVDSIKYARRIQTSLMPNQRFLSKHLNDRTEGKDQ